MAKNRFLLDMRPRDADAPGFYDLNLNIDRLMRELRNAPCLDRLCRKMDMTRVEVLKTFTPGAAVDPATGEVSINAGYDPSFDEGILETIIWHIISHEVGCILASGSPPAKCSRLPSSWAVLAIIVVFGSRSLTLTTHQCSRSLLACSQSERRACNKRVVLTLRANATRRP